MLHHVIFIGVISIFHIFTPVILFVLVIYIQVLYIAIRGISPSTNEFRFIVYNQLFSSPSYATSVQSNSNNGGNPIIDLDVLESDDP